jgi:hypothetical protein
VRLGHRCGCRVTEAMTLRGGVFGGCHSKFGARQKSGGTDVDVLSGESFVASWHAQLPLPGHLRASPGLSCSCPQQDEAFRSLLATYGSDD